ncbi:MAG: hypothetical protein J1G38_04670 [Clostridiales bacterium]|nr:hypothetical protein [Clostridiales bacterium]
MKMFKKIGAIALAGCLAIGMAGCGGAAGGGGGNRPTREYDNENDPLLLATTEVDGVFNPFFSSSATDSNVVGMTQLGMMTSDADGNLAYGENEDTLVLDYQSVLDLGANGNNVDLDNDTRTTTFYFVLKNNVKFSDGKPVTMKDVLFNLYVYLDMAYTGSSTIYSTDIVGLQEYRTQEESEKEQNSFMLKYQSRARNRIDALVSAWESLGYDKTPKPNLTEAQLKAELKSIQDGGNANNANLVADFEATTKFFKEELEDDWSMARDSYSDIVFKDEAGKEYKNLFTTDVEVFLYNEGKITWNKKDGKLESAYATDEEMKAGVLKKWTKESAINIIYSENIPENLGEVVTYWMTASKLFEDLTNKELEKDAETMEKTFDNISGIKFANGGAARGGEDSVVVNGKTYTTPTYAEDGSVQGDGHEVLSIKIKGVDPKAKWNFSFPVAPMHYYSSDKYIKEFDYVKNFGLPWSSQTFMNDVVKHPNKIGVPVGAGPYMAVKQSGGRANAGDAGEFRANGIIYYERNPYYVNVAGHNPKIKKVRYVVVASNQMTTDLYSGRVDYSEPNAKPETKGEIDKKSGYSSMQAKTNGYGYIGINAGKLPYLNVRRAIMYSINTKLCIDYYKNTAEQIWRSMSTASQYYPEGATAYYPYIGGAIPNNLDVVDPAYKAYITKTGKKSGQTLSRAEQKEFIRLLMEEPYSLDANSYPGNPTKYKFQKINGVYEKSGSATHWCRYTFTIAGEVTDHPAWSALFNAADLLNDCGFEVTVKTDSTALQKLASGQLAVWAAAWSSTIDPDMYQVYHKDSKASSVQNWGYPSILRNAGGIYDTENKILDVLSNYIEQGRQYEEFEERYDFYEAALDEVIKLAVELPTYQRNDLYAYNTRKIDKNSLSTPTAYRSPTSELYNVSLIVKNEVA